MTHDFREMILSSPVSLGFLTFFWFEWRLDDSLFCSSGHVTKACDVLRSIEEFKHKAGMVGFHPRRGKDVLGVRVGIKCCWLCRSQLW